MNNELYHYGVKGMKWGVRRARQKEEYGYTRKELKKKIKEAKRDYKRSQGHIIDFSGRTGENWNKVESRHRKAAERDTDLKKWRTARDVSRAVSSVADATKKETTRDISSGIGDVYQSRIDRRRAEIGKKYAQQYDDALLKDIGYKDIEKGRKMLNEYRIHNNWGKYLGEGD